MKNNFPCICGHNKVFHKNSYEDFPNGLNMNYCTKCYNEEGEFESIHDFVGDNLKYLEDINELEKRF